MYFVSKFEENSSATQQPKLWLQWKLEMLHLKISCFWQFYKGRWKSIRIIFHRIYELRLHNKIIFNKYVQKVCLFYAFKTFCFQIYGLNGIIKSEWWLHNVPWMINRCVASTSRNVLLVSVYISTYVSTSYHCCCCCLRGVCCQ